MLYRRLYEKVFQLDFYSQPLSLTYQGKSNFSTPYGIVMTIITFCLILFVIIDTFVYWDNLYTFEYAEPLNTTVSFNINLLQETAIFISLLNKDVK